MIEMKYPSLDQFIKNNFDFAGASTKDTMDQSFTLIASCIDKIYNEEEVWECGDVTKKEMTEFLEQMNSTQFKILRNSSIRCQNFLIHSLSKILTQKLRVKLFWKDYQVFSRILAHIDLESYYKLNFALIQYHKYSLTEIENLIPWERDIYVALLKEHLENEKLKAQQNAT